jgi:hypothetical protein
MMDPFDSSRRKIARAKEHLVDLKAKIDGFAGENPYIQVIEEDPERPGYQLHKIKLIKAMPEAFADSVGDAVNNLRSALDHACYAVAVASGNTAPRYAYFPFARDAGGLENSIRGNCKDIPQEIYPLLRSFEPYGGGNEILWTLNLICVADKHKILTPVGTGVMRPGNIEAKGGGFLSVPINPVWDRTKQEVKFLTLGPGAAFDYKFDFILFIAFDEIGTVTGEPVRHILDQISTEVERTVSTIESEARSLGIVK